MNTAASSTMADPTRDATRSHIRYCGHCGLPYDWRRSASSSLKMTYCGSLCEKGDLGFTIESLLQTQRSPFGAVMAAAAAA
ncbi:MAG: hypothetical protein ACRDHF_05565 [Tepidiformaceae bacterium]